MKQRMCGFTLVEVLFVVVIAAGVLVFVVPSLKGARERAAYMEGTGMLMDVGNAVDSLERDLRMYKKTVQIPSSSANAENMSNTDAVSSVTNKRLDEIVWTTSNINKQARAVLKDSNRGYLDGFRQAGGYTFYIGTKDKCKTACSDNGNFSKIRRKESANASSSLPADTKVCMCKTGTKNGCYAGAAYTTDGRVVRVPTNDCKEKTTDNIYYW